MLLLGSVHRCKAFYFEGRVGSRHGLEGLGHNPRRKGLAENDCVERFCSAELLLCATKSCWRTPRRSCAATSETAQTPARWVRHPAAFGGRGWCLEKAEHCQHSWFCLHHYFSVRTIYSSDFRFFKCMSVWFLSAPVLLCKTIYFPCGLAINFCMLHEGRTRFT